MFFPILASYNPADSLFKNEVYEQRISIDERNISLKELLQKLGSASHTPIEVSKNLSNCRLKIKLKNRTLFEILNNIETLYDGEYKKVDNKIYFSLTKTRSDESKNWWKTYNKERDLAIRRLAEFRRKAFDNVPREQKPDKTFAEVAFWKKLSNELKDGVANDIDQRYFYKLNIEDLLYRKFLSSLLINKNSFSNDILEEVSSSVRSYQLDTPYGDFSFAGFNFNDISLNWSFSKVYIAVVKDDISIVTGLQISFTPNSPDEAELLKKVYSTIQLNHRPLQNVFDKDLKVSKNIKELINASKSKFWSDGAMPAGEPGKDLEVYSRNNIIDCLSENSDFEFISDLYYQPETLLPEKEKQRISTDKPENIIEKYMSGWDVSVKKNNHITMIRNNKWYRDDYLMPDVKICNDMVGLYSKATSVDPTKATDWDYVLLRNCSYAIRSHSLFQISNGLSNYIPNKNVDSILFKGSYAYPLSQISDFILYKYELLDFVNDLHEEMFKAIISTGIEYKNLSGPMREKLFKIPSVRIRPPSSPNDIIRIKVVNSPIVMNFKSPNSGIIPRLSNIDYTIEVIKQ